MSASLYRSPSAANAALYKSPSVSAFGAPFGSMSVADLGSLTRLEVKLKKKKRCSFNKKLKKKKIIIFRIKFVFFKKIWNLNVSSGIGLV